MTGIAGGMSKINRIYALELRRLCRIAAEGWLVTKDGVMRVMRRRVKPRFWVFMIAVTLVVFGASFFVMQLRYTQGERRLAEAQAIRDDMTMQVNALSDQLAFAQTDDYVIRAARDELGMIMPGEIRYVNGAR